MSFWPYISPTLYYILNTELHGNKMGAFRLESGIPAPFFAQKQFPLLTGFIMWHVR
jgi:hypothetical protein